MPKPWEKYQQQTQSEGPWSKYERLSDQAPSMIPYKQQEAEPNQEDVGIGEALLGAGETALGFATSAVAQPIAGIAGLAQLPVKGLEAGAETIEKTREALTYEPRTEAGKEYQQAIGEFLQPVGEAIGSAGEYLGDATREATGSWILGGIAQSIPEAVLELVGVKGAGKLVSPKSALPKSPKAALSQSAPNIKQLRTKATQLYNEISDAGVTVNKSDYLNLGVQLNNIARQSGFDPNLTPKMAGFLERVQSDFKKPQLTVSDVDQLRKIAQIPANSIDNATEAAIGSKMISKIDEFLDAQGEIIAKQAGPDIGKKYREARSITSRVKKAELLDEAVFKAGEAASGFENGLRNEIRSILKNKKKRRGFNTEEIKTMQQITQGGTLENTMKRLGRLGYGVDQQTNVLASLVGIGAGAQLFGPAGAIAAPAIGMTAANIAKKLGARNAKFLNDITRSGKSGVDIVDSYMKNVPKKLHSREELTALLLDPSVDIFGVVNLANKYKSNAKFIKDAEYAARKLKIAQATGALLAPESKEDTEQ